MAEFYTQLHSKLSVWGPWGAGPDDPGEDPRDTWLPRGGRFRKDTQGGNAGQ